MFIWQFHCILWYKLSKDDLKYLGRCVKAECGCATVLYNELEHLWSLVSVGGGGVAKINPLLIERQLYFSYVPYGYFFSDGYCPCILRHFA